MSIFSITCAVFFLGYVYNKVFNKDKLNNVLACGLTGYSGTSKVNLMNIRMLLLCNKTRGTDSTGVAGNQRFRALMPADKFIQQQAFETSLVNSKLVIGHTRKKSFGSITKDSAHPFKMGFDKDVLFGAHNGTIHTIDLNRAADYFDISHEGMIDSEYIFSVLYEKRDKKGRLKFNDVLPYIDGAMALSIKYRDTLYLYRREGYNGRPLFYTITNDGFYYSSIEESLAFLGHKYKEGIKEVTPNKLYVIKEGKIVETQDIDKPYNNSYGFNKKTGKPNTPPKKALPPASGGRKIGFDSYPQSSIFDKRPEPKSKIETSDLKRWEEIIDSCIANFPALEKEVKELDSFDSSFDQCYLVTHLTCSYNKHTIPLDGFLIWLEDPEDGKTRLYGITSEDGSAAIRIPPRWFKNGDIHLKIGCTDPLWGEEYYSSTIDLSSGRVLEVALNLPFHNHEKRLSTAYNYGGDEEYRQFITRAQQASKVPNKSDLESSLDVINLRESVSKMRVSPEKNKLESVSPDRSDTFEAAGQDSPYILNTELRKAAYTLCISKSLEKLRPIDKDIYDEYLDAIFEEHLDETADRECLVYNYNNPEEYKEEALAIANEDDKIHVLIKAALNTMKLPKGLYDELDHKKIIQDAALLDYMLLKNPNADIDVLNLKHFFAICTTVSGYSLKNYIDENVLPFDNGHFVEPYSLTDDTDDLDILMDINKCPMYWITGDYKEATSKEAIKNIEDYLTAVIEPAIESIDKLKEQKLSKTKLEHLDDLSAYFLQLDHDLKMFIGDNNIPLTSKRNLPINEEYRTINEMNNCIKYLFKSVKDIYVLHHIRRLSEAVKVISDDIGAYLFIIST